MSSTCNKKSKKQPTKKENSQPEIQDIMDALNNKGCIIRTHDDQGALAQLSAKLQKQRWASPRALASVEAANLFVPCPSVPYDKRTTEQAQSSNMPVWATTTMFKEG